MVQLAHLDVAGSDGINGLVISPTYKWFVYGGERSPTDPITFDPITSFPGHPSTIRENLEDWLPELELVVSPINRL